MKFYLHQYLTNEKPSLVVKVLVWVSIALTLVGLLVVGFFAFIVGLGMAIILWLIVMIRGWWANHKHRNDCIEVEYRKH